MSDNLQQFESYEISHVVERRDITGGDDRYCVVLAACGDSIENVRKMPDYKADFWTLYGRLPDGEAVAIEDCESEAAASDILAMIGGARTH